MDRIASLEDADESVQSTHRKERISNTRKRRGPGIRLFQSRASTKVEAEIVVVLNSKL